MPDASLKKKTFDYYKALYAIASEVDSMEALEKELAALVKGTAEAMGAKGCSIFLLTEDGASLIRGASYGISARYIGRVWTVELDALTMETLKGEPRIIRDATTDPRVKQHHAQIKMEGIASIASVPLIVQGKVIGVLRLYTDRPTEFSAADVAFLSGVANLGASAISRDQVITAIGQQYEHRLREKSEELAKLAEARNKLIESVSVVAHDLKAPLAAIQSYFGVMLGGYAGELNEKQRQMIERSSIRIDGLLNLISDLLDISRIEMGQVAKEMETISLPDILKGPLEDAKTLVDKQNIVLTVDAPPDLPPVRGSPARLKQVFRNLLGNAVKFTPGGGTISVKISESDGEIVCKVRDTGIGIPAEDIPRIFNDFYRASNAKDISGTGLGLSIVKKIVEAHKGEIQATSPCPETGKGSEFTFTLPLADFPPTQGEKEISTQAN